MKVKLLRDCNVLMPTGAEVDVDEARAKWLIANGAAVPAELPKPKKPAKKTNNKEG